jgi:predicted Zn-dependent protease
MVSRYLYISIFILILLGCSKSAFTDRNQLILVTESEELSLGEREAKNILSTAKISTDIANTNLVKRVGKKIADVSDKSYNWEFYLIEEDTLNAFCLPGGKVFVYSGILKVAKTEGQLATVMSHEIAHALARHGAERLSMAQLNSFGKNILSQALSLENPLYKNIFDSAYGVGSNIAIMLPHSRSNESEADYIGLILMKKAGYNPSEAIAFWENMKKMKSEGENFPFLSTHPSDSKRIEDIKGAIGKI